MAPSTYAKRSRFTANPDIEHQQAGQYICQETLWFSEDEFASFREQVYSVDAQELTYAKESEAWWKAVILLFKEARKCREEDDWNCQQIQVLRDALASSYCSCEEIVGVEQILLSVLCEGSKSIRRKSINILRSEDPESAATKIQALTLSHRLIAQEIAVALATAHSLTEQGRSAPKRRRTSLRDSFRNKKKSLRSSLRKSFHFLKV